jgi:acyl-CoA synthetase (AMP-forming)/AMP-acid ligase II
MFTSGTTGLPKGVRSTHGTVLAAYRALSDVVGLTSSDRYLIVNPLFHAFGYRAGWLSCVLRGATVLPFARFEVEQLLQTVARELVTVLPGTPTVFQSILDSGHAGDYDLSSLRLSITGATMTSTLLVRRMHEELGFDSVLTGYGLTEHCGVATMCRPGDDFAARTTTSGRVIPGAELRIAAVDGEDADAGGEILVRGYVMAGYHEDARATSAVLGADGWLHTGDIGYLRPDGNLVVVGRLGDMFIVGGFNVYPAEVEALLTSHPAVKDAAVVGVPDRRMGEVGCAFIVPRDQHPPTEDELIAWCRDRLANFKVPRSVRYVSALPRTANGKVRSEELRTLAGRRAAD